MGSGLTTESPAAAAPALTTLARLSIEPPAPTEAADEETAMRFAIRYRKPVEVLDERTQSSQTFAQPDGSLRARYTATPQRVRRGSGWVPIDTVLKRADGVVVPEATTLDMRFSAGGTGADGDLGERCAAPLPVLAHGTA